MPRITVITAVKNAAEYLPDTIASIQAQTMGDWRYVIVDDASDDATPKLAEAAAAEDPRIEVIRLTESIGAYAAANLGAQDVDSQYIARIDGDDIAAPSRFASQLAALDADGRARACTGSWRLLENETTGPTRPVPSHDNGVIKWMMWFRSNLLHSTLMMNTALFHEIGGYGPERIAEDFRLWATLVRRNLLTVVDELLVDYRVTPTQITAEADARDKPERLRIALDHMQQCDPGGSWSLDDARDIRWVGHAADFTAHRAISLLDRFERAWRSDASLSESAREALRTMTAARRVRHLRQNLRRQPFSVAQHPLVLLRSGVRALKDREHQWP